MSYTIILWKCYVSYDVCGKIREQNTRLTDVSAFVSALCDTFLVTPTVPCHV